MNNYFLFNRSGVPDQTKFNFTPLKVGTENVNTACILSYMSMHDLYID